MIPISTVNEAGVIWSLKQRLQREGLDGRQVSDIAVDSDGAYRASPYAAQLEPMLSLPILGFYPDVVCSYSNSSEEGIAAFEVKGRFEDWLKGVTQARAYREGVHRSYLALPFEKQSRMAALERDAHQSGIGVWLLEKSTWHEVIQPATPRPGLITTRALSAALRGVALPKRLQLNHPLNYLAVAYARARLPQNTLQEAMEREWGDLRSESTRQHAINGARCLGLLTMQNGLTRLGLVAVDLMESLGFNAGVSINKRERFCTTHPGMAAVARMVFLQQESVTLVVDALGRAGKSELNTEELFRVAATINPALAGGLFLTDPKDIKRDQIVSDRFSPSFVFKFKQMLWHAGILSLPAHPTAGKEAGAYRHLQDLWNVEDRWALR
ncbi:MAG: hypothetical protein JWL59_4815 [Chthoniobacteraceae bacterium]|nr:hypothetical protein [Chthoniobacteraceae bacterium]